MAAFSSPGLKEARAAAVERVEREVERDEERTRGWAIIGSSRRRLQRRDVRQRGVTGAWLRYRCRARPPLHETLLRSTSPRAGRRAPGRAARAARRAGSW